MEKLNLLLESLSEKFPDIFDSDVKKNLLETITNIVEAEKATESKDELTDELTEEIRAEIYEEVKEELSEEMKSDLDLMASTIDIFSNQCSEEYFEEKNEEISEAVGKEVSTDVLNVMRKLVENHGMEVNESDEKVVETHQKEIDSLNKTISSLTGQLSERQNAEIKIGAAKLFEAFTSDLSEERKEKFAQLIENESIDDLEHFEKRLKFMKSLIVEAKVEDTVEEKEVEKIEEQEVELVDPQDHTITSYTDNNFNLSNIADNL